MSHIRTEIAGAVGVLTIDRRERFNSLDVETAQDLRREALRLARERSVRAVVMRGAGGVFCSGADLKYIRAGGAEREVAYLQQGRELPRGHGKVFQQILEYLHSTISEIRRAPKPFVAAVDGMAAAGGFGLAMACDLVLISSDARLEWAYGKTGLSGAESSTFLLPRLIGLRRAFGMVLLNPRLDAEQALEMGLVNEIVPTGSLDRRAREVVEQLAAGPTEAFAAAKALLNRAAGMDRLDYHLDQELEALVRSADSAEFAEGIEAFFEKREPHFEEGER